MHETNDKLALITEVQTSRNVRNKGHARAMMESVCADADREGVILVLNADPQEPSVNLPRLIAFYQTLGFELIPEAETAMRRDPKVTDLPT